MRWDSATVALLFKEMRQAGTTLLAALQRLAASGDVTIRPKMHQLCHIIYGMGVESPCRNPLSGCTWRDEDCVKNVMRVVKALHPRSVATKSVAYISCKLNLVLREEQ
jgi:hypothetical protein